MDLKLIDTSVIRTGQFQMMRREAQLLYFYLAMYSDDRGYADAFVVGKIAGTNYVEINILVRNGFIEITDEHSSIVRVNGAGRASEA